MESHPACLPLCSSWVLTVGTNTIAVFSCSAWSVLPVPNTELWKNGAEKSSKDQNCLQESRIHRACGGQLPSFSPGNSYNKLPYGCNSGWVTVLTLKEIENQDISLLRGVWFSNVLFFIVVLFVWLCATSETDVSFSNTLWGNMCLWEKF